VLQNQGLLSIAFFEAASSIVLLVLFLLFRKDHHSNYFRSWVVGWSVFTLTSISEAALAITPMRGFDVMLVVGHVASSLLFLIAVIQYTATSDRLHWPIFPPLALILITVIYLEANGLHVDVARWATAIIESAVLLVAGWLLWRGRATQDRYGAGSSCGKPGCDARLDSLD
jgi:hypothetical protein